MNQYKKKIWLLVVLTLILSTLFTITALGQEKEEPPDEKEEKPPEPPEEKKEEPPDEKEQDPQNSLAQISIEPEFG